MACASEKNQNAFDLRSRVNHDFARRRQTRHNRAMKFGAVGMHRRVDGIHYLDAKERSLRQTVYAVAASGIEPGVEVKGQHRSSSDVDRDRDKCRARALGLSDVCEYAGKKQSH